MNPSQKLKLLARLREKTPASGKTVPSRASSPVLAMAGQPHGVRRRGVQMGLNQDKKGHLCLLSDLGLSHLPVS